MFEIVPFDRHIRHLAAMDPFREFEELERSAKVDTELERLMTEMGMMPETSTDDELAALQAEVAAAAAEAQENLAEAGAPAET